MIDVTKTYKTRDGREVNVLAVASGLLSDDCVVCIVDGEVDQWYTNGQYWRHEESNNDLIECKPRIKRDVWVNVYNSVTSVMVHETKADADKKATANRYACIKVTIACEHGEGL